MHPLIPLLILVVVLLGAAAIGFAVYTIATDIANKAGKKIEDHNVSFGKDGMKINMREVKHEDYVNRTQNVLVQAWNLSTWPAYKSRFWNKDKGAGAGAGTGASASGSSSKSRPSSSKSSSSSSGATRSSSSRVHTVSHRTENGRLAEPKPVVRRTNSGSSIPGSFD